MTTTTEKTPGMADHEKRIRHELSHADADALAFVGIAASDLRALLADLDAMRGALTKIANADSGEGGCYYTNRANINIARSTIKGASA